MVEGAPRTANRSPLGGRSPRSVRTPPRSRAGRRGRERRFQERNGRCGRGCRTDCRNRCPQRGDCDRWKLRPAAFRFLDRRPPLPATPIANRRKRSEQVSDASAVLVPGRLRPLSFRERRLDAMPATQSSIPQSLVAIRLETEPRPFRGRRDPCRPAPPRRRGPWGNRGSAGRNRIPPRRVNPTNSTRALAGRRSISPIAGRDRAGCDDFSGEIAAVAAAALPADPLVRKHDQRAAVHPDESLGRREVDCGDGGWTVNRSIFIAPRAGAKQAERGRSDRRRVRVHYIRRGEGLLLGGCPREGVPVVAGGGGMEEILPPRPNRRLFRCVLT